MTGYKRDSRKGPIKSARTEAYLLVGGNIKAECLFKMTLRHTAQCATGRYDVYQLACVEQLKVRP